MDWSKITDISQVPEDQLGSYFRYLEIQQQLKEMHESSKKKKEEREKE